MKYFVVDALAILAFAIFARLAHKAEPFGVVSVFNTWWPFLIGVVIAWIFLQVQKRPAVSWTSGAIVWACAVFAGLGFWAGEHGRVPHISFIIVATVMSGLLLMGWRLVARLAGRRHTR